MKGYTDSTLMGMKKNDLIGIIRCLENNVLAAEEKNNNQFNLLMKIELDEQQYRWHDLRKNPEDLPKQNKSVIFATNDGCVQEGEWNYSCWVQYRWSTHRDNSEVIAWREIKPFEEEEE